MKTTLALKLLIHFTKIGRKLASEKQGGNRLKIQIYLSAPFGTKKHLISNPFAQMQLKCVLDIFTGTPYAALASSRHKKPR